MLVRNRSQIDGIELFPHLLRLDTGGEKTPFMRLRDLPGLRQILGEFLLDLIGQNQHSWFPDLCGRCGNSCRRPEILVRQQEIFPIQRQLGLREQEFRQRYLGPAQTWNELDGHMLLNSQGACPFLQASEGAQAEPQTATCSIYSVRPRSCRELTSNQSYCRKDPGHLLQSLSSCRVEPSQIVVMLDTGQLHHCDTPPGAWAQLTQAILDSPEPEDRRLPEIVESLVEIFGEEIRDFSPSKADSAYADLIERLYRVLREAADLVQLGDNQEIPLEEAWRHYHHLQRLLNRPASDQGRPIGSLTAKLPWEALVVRETDLVARLPSGREEALKEALKEPLQAARRAFVLAVLQTQDEVLQEALTPPEPECIFCGECCRRYSVEIHPGDVTRLSRYLEMPAGQFVDEFTEPGFFSWNPKDRVLKKKRCQSYSRNLLELTVRGQSEDQECIFLDRKEDGLFYCRVHTHKPDVCRSYQPTNVLCRTSNHLENPGRQAENLAWVEVDRSQVIVQTRQRQQKKQAPLVLPRAEWRELDEAAHALEAACSGS